jgi:pantoate kinase
MVIVAQQPVSIAKAFSPGHVTGFFATDKGLESLHPNFNGSLGAGFSIGKGMTTTVKVYKDNTKSYSVLLNGLNSVDARVSKFVIEHYLGMVHEPVFISVEHESEIPIGYGLGSSGSAALSLSYALNQALKTNLTKIQAAQIAHTADVVCKTGLGTVISEFTGGFEIRTSFGGPGIGKVLKIPVSPGYCAVILCIKPINTACLLDKSQLSRKKNFLDGLGREMVHILKQNPRVDTFLELSNRFADEFGLLDGYCKEPFLSLQSIGIKSSVALFGHALFAILKKQNLQKVIRVLSGFDGKLIVCDIDNSGAKLIDKPYGIQ